MHTFNHPPAKNPFATETVTAPASTAAEIAALLETAENAEQERRKRYALLRAGFLWFFAAQIAAAATFLLTPAHGSGWVAAIGMSGYGGAFAALAAYPREVTKRQKNAAEALLKFPHEPRILLPLLDTLVAPHEQSTFYPPLTERLWHLSATDAALSFDATRRARLRFLLSQAKKRLEPGTRTYSPTELSAETADLAVAIMRTLTQIGDIKTVKILQKIVKAKAETANEEVVRDAAREYLPVLEQQIAENEAMQIKLRACLRGPQNTLADYLNTLAPEDAKIALVKFLQEAQTTIPYLPSVTDIVVWLTVGFIVFRGSVAKWNDIVGFVFLILVVYVLSVVFLRPLFNEIHGNNRNARRVASEVARRAREDTRLISVLLQRTKQSVFQIHKNHDDTIGEVLIRLLPKLAPGDAALIPLAQRACLRSLLKCTERGKATPHTHALTIAALHAVAAIGDTKALPQIQKIARETNADFTNAELHQAALRAMEHLRNKPPQ